MDKSESFEEHDGSRLGVREGHEMVEAPWDGSAVGLIQELLVVTFLALG